MAKADFHVSGRPVFDADMQHLAVASGFCEAVFLQMGFVVAVRLSRSGTDRGRWHPMASA